MVEVGVKLFFSSMGVAVTSILTIYEGFKIYRWEEGFSGSINSHFRILIDYIALSGILFSFFFIVSALGAGTMSTNIFGIPIFDVFFLLTTLIWMYTAYRIFENLEEMSNKYFSK